MKRNLFCLSLLLIGCGTQTPTPPETLNVWSALGDAETTVLLQTADEHEKRTGVKVKVQTVPLGQLQEKYLNAFKSGQVDVVVGVPSDWLSTWVPMGALQPVDKAGVAMSDFFDAAEQAARMQSQHWGVPLFTETVALFYNKKHIANPPTTWDEMLKLAKALNQSDQGVTGLAFDLESVYLTHGLYASFGGYSLKLNADGFDPSNVGINTTGAVQALQTLHDLRYLHKLIPASDGQSFDDLFEKGQLGMTISGPWNIAKFKQAKIDLGFAPIPTPSGQPWAAWAGTQLAVMNAKTTKAAQAQNFLKDLGGVEHQTDTYLNSGRFPSNSKAVTALPADSVLSGFASALKSSVALPNVAEMGFLWGPWSSAQISILRNATPDIQGSLNDARGQYCTSSKKCLP